jgi:CheY-like chemotaxis protein
LRAVLGHEIDTVLLDLTLPHLDGAEVPGEIRRESSTLPVVVMSGYNEQDVTDNSPGSTPIDSFRSPSIHKSVSTGFVNWQRDNSCSFDS